jgi:acetyl esterase
MALHPQVEMVLELAARAGNPPYWELTPDQARALHERTAPVLDAKPVALARVTDLELPGPAGPVAARAYRAHASSAPLPALVWFHGGGHVVGSVRCYDALCRQLALASGVVVVSVDYRLAPEHKFPAAVEDAMAALRWVASHAGRLGVDGTRIAVGGDSAGGNLAAVSAILARDAGDVVPVFQLLVYPATGAWPDTASHAAFAEGHLLERRAIDWFQGHYVRGPADRTDFRFAPLLADDLSGLPDALVVVAECDPLRDEGIAYAERLQAAGSGVELTCYDGMIHAFLSLSGALDAGREAIAHCGRALREALAP